MQLYYLPEYFPNGPFGFPMAALLQPSEAS